jgi:hypothetical protein
VAVAFPGGLRDCGGGCIPFASPYALGFGIYIASESKFHEIISIQTLSKHFTGNIAHVVHTDNI